MLSFWLAAPPEAPLLASAFALELLEPPAPPDAPVFVGNSRLGVGMLADGEPPPALGVPMVLRAPPP
jgi:hypothetical protein